MSLWSVWSAYRHGGGIERLDQTVITAKEDQVEIGGAPCSLQCHSGDAVVIE